MWKIQLQTDKTKKKNLQASIPDLQKTVPGSCRNGHSIISNSQAANTVVMSCQHTWNKDGTFIHLVQGCAAIARYCLVKLSITIGWNKSTRWATYQHGQLLVCPTRYSWSHRILPEADGHSLRTQQKWCHRWCCRESRSWVPDRRAGQTACRWHRRSPWQKHCH